MLGPLADRMTSLQESPELALFVYTEERPHEDKERDGCPRARAGVGGLTRTRAASFPRRARPVSTQPPELRGSNARRLRRQHVRSSRSGRQPLRRPPCSEPGSRAQRRAWDTVSAQALPAQPAGEGATPVSGSDTRRGQDVRWVLTGRAEFSREARRAQPGSGAPRHWASGGDLLCGSEA